MIERFRKYGLRTLLLIVLAFSLVFGFGFSWYNVRIKQQRDVEKLIYEVGGFHETPQFVSSNLCVWYDGNLQWLEDEGRYEITVTPGSPFPSHKHTGIAGWLDANLGRDFVESPIAIEIECHDTDESTLTDELVEQIKKLPTVKQVWLVECTDTETGELRNRPNQSTIDNLARLFPNLIIASPQRNRDSPTQGSTADK